jgi:hypothetical protein
MAGNKTGNTIDLDILTEKVYRLFLEEKRLMSSRVPKKNILTPRNTKRG